MANSKSNSATIAIAVVFIFLTFTAAILVIYFTTFYNSDHIPYNQANAPLGEFAAEPSSRSSNIKNICGTNANLPCVRTVNNLEGAINYCNLYSEICDRFMYSEKTRTVSIVDLKGRLDKSPDHNLYTRQVGITYNSPGVDKSAYSSPGLTFIDSNPVQTISTNTTSSVTSSSGGRVSTGTGGGSGGGGGGY